MNGIDADGEDVYWVTSDVPVDLYEIQRSNYWGRNCGKGTNGLPLFQPEVDSNIVDEVDSYPFLHSVSNSNAQTDTSFPCD